MKNGICPRCESREIIMDMPLRHVDRHVPYVAVGEPEPASRPFIWTRQTERSDFVVYVCGDCGLSEFYATNHTGLRDGVRRGFTPNY